MTNLRLEGDEPKLEHSTITFGAGAAHLSSGTSVRIL